MSKKTVKDNKILFLFSRNMLDQIPRIEKKEVPSEVLYGAMELLSDDWKVEISDVGDRGLFGKISFFLKRHGVNIISLTTMTRIAANDIIIVKDDFSLVTTLFCRLLGKTIIYKDAMFQIPRRFWRRWSVSINFRLATAVIAYSDYQARIWERKFKLKPNHIKTMRYCIDTTFYPRVEHTPSADNYAISIGRDKGRDYDTLSRASRQIGMKVKLITLPYLLSDEIRSNKNIEILQYIPYEQLFEFYKNSAFSVVPLTKGIDYPSGIRGILESLALGVPTISTKSPVLEEYFEDDEDLMFVEADNDEILAITMKSLTESPDLMRNISINGMNKVRRQYNMTTYKNELVEIITKTAV